MIDGRPTVFISYSERSKTTVAIPFRNFVNSLGLHGVLVGDEPTPDIEDPTPDRKVAYYLDESNMFVALATDDVRVEGGEVQTRQNIALEIGKAFDRPHLKRKVQIFKAAEVTLPSNINVVHEPLDPQNVADCFPLFERQARTFNLLGGHPQDLAPDEPTQPPTETEPSTETDSHEAREAAGALRDLGDLLEGTEEPGEDEAGSIAARAYLASLTALGLIRSASLLGAHELNGLYRDRESVKPSDAEESTLLSAIVANVGSANCPGWYWFRGRTSREIQALILGLTQESSDVAARRGAIQLLSRSPNRPTSRELRDCIRTALSDDGGVRSDALMLLEAHGTTADLVALKDALDSSRDAKGIEKVRLAVQSREAPSSAFRTIVANAALLTPQIEEELIRSARKISESAARQLLDSDSPSGRRLSLQILNAKSRLRKDDALSVMNADPDSSVRILAAEIAVRRRWKITEEDFDAACADSGFLFRDDTKRLAIHFFGQQDPVELMASLRSDRVRSYAVYEALAIKHFDVIEHRICNDLDADFATLIDESEAAYRSEFEAAFIHDFEKKHGVDISQERRAEINALVDTRMQPWRDGNAKHWNFMLRQFRLAALAGMAIRGDTDHAKYGRRFANDEDWQIANAAVRLLGSTGDDSDLPLLLEKAVTSSFGISRTIAAEAALSVSPDPEATARELLVVDDEDVVGAALATLRAAPLENVFETVFPLLRSDSFGIRDKATQFTLDGFDRWQKRLLADLYPKGQYYYSVITRVDRELYAPGWIKESATTILGSS